MVTTPRSFWFISGFLLLWGCAYAWLVVNTFVLADPDYFDALVADGIIRQEYADYIQRLPAWVVATTALTALSRLGGAVALLLRLRLSVLLYAISLLCVCVIFTRGFVFANVGQVIRSSQIGVEALFFALSVFALCYAIYASKNNYLR